MMGFVSTSTNNASSTAMHSTWLALGHYRCLQVTDKNSTTGLLRMDFCSLPLWLLPLIFFLMFLPCLLKCFSSWTSPHSQNVPCKLPQWLSPYSSSIYSICFQIDPQKTLLDTVECVQGTFRFHPKPYTVLYIGHLFSPVPFFWCSVGPSCFY